MTDGLVMTFRTTGLGGVPGMLRSRAAVSDTVSVPAEMALKIARQIEAGEALYLATLDLRDRADRAETTRMFWMCGVLAAVLNDLLSAVLA